MKRGRDYTGLVLENRYQVEQLLGEGGMGSVYAGRHRAIGRQVAIKFLHAELSHDPEVLRRFYREAQTAAGIGHANIIEVLDVGVSPEDEPFIVMEYLEGESLCAMLARVRTVDLPAACGVLEPVLLALQAAHNLGIVHRDLKPDNIFLVHREHGLPFVKLIDFGISKVLGGGEASRLTQAGVVLGTPAYMSPEQAQGKDEVDHRTDLYAMGVILYEMLTGGLPFQGKQYNELLINLLTQEPKPPREVNPAFPAEAEALVLRCLSKDPALRPQSATAFVDELKALKAFERRSERLTHFTSSAVKRSFAGGYLGDSEENSHLWGRMTSDVLESISPSAAAWTLTGPIGARRRFWLIAAGAVFGAIVASGLVFLGGFIAQTGSGAKTSAQVADSTDSERRLPEVVHIELVGVPSGARVEHNGIAVPSNPFALPRTTELSTLTVTAKGFEPFSTALVPSDNLKLTVELRPLTPAPLPAPPVASKPKQRPKPKPAPAARPQEPQPERRLSSGRKGTIISEEFE